MKRYRVSDKMRKTFLEMSAGNRRFFDHLCCLLWCECKDTNPHKSTSWHDWCNIQLNYWGTSKHAFWDETGEYNTPRNVFNNQQLDALQSFIDTHTFHDLTEAQRQITEDLFNDCVACGLNVLQDRYSEPEKPKKRKRKMQQLMFDFDTDTTTTT